jgi:YVTN family beta-propeller protein
VTRPGGWATKALAPPEIVMRPLALLSLLLLAAVPQGGGAAPAPVYAVTDRIAGPDGTWDYASVDPAGKRLYVARASGVTMVTLATGEVVTLGALERGHAVVPLADGRLLVTSGNDGSVRLFDAAGQQTASIAVGKKPDAALLDPAGTHAFVMNADSGTISVIDLATARVTRTIPAKPALEYAVFAQDGTLFVNNEDANEIETIDVARGVAGAAIALPGCAAPTGLGYDRAHNRLIASCANRKAAIVDAHARRLVALVDIGAGPDAVIMDPTRALAFIPCGKDGVLEILSLADATVRRVATVTTEIGARTGAIDPATGTLYLPTARFAPGSAPGARPVAIPGSFHILVVRPR